jgi:virginiamycin B lyase
MWFTTEDGAIGRITVNGKITLHRVFGATLDIVTGPDGALWFTDPYNNSIGRLSAGGVVRYFTDPSIAFPSGITSGPDGALWFTNEGPLEGNHGFHGPGSIGRIATSGVVSNFSNPAIDNPVGITTGPDGALWFTDIGSDLIGRITAGGTISTYGGPAIDDPVGIVSGPDGALWFTNDPLTGWDPIAECNGSGSIGRITTDGVASGFEAGSVVCPGGITDGPDGALWFTNSGAGPGTSSIGRITTAGAITDFTNPTVVIPSGIVSGPDGTLWFTNAGGDTIGRIVAQKGMR